MWREGEERWVTWAESHPKQTRMWFTRKLALSVQRSNRVSPEQQTQLWGRDPQGGSRRPHTSKFPNAVFCNLLCDVFWSVLCSDAAKYSSTSRGKGLWQLLLPFTGGGLTNVNQWLNQCRHVYVLFWCLKHPGPVGTVCDVWLPPWSVWGVTVGATWLEVATTH